MQITHKHKKKVVKNFYIKNSGKYHGLHVQSETLLLADVFNNFLSMCLEIYGLDPVHFLSTARLAWQTTLKKKQIKITSIN